MAQYDKLWNKWYTNKVLNEMKPKIASRVVAVSDAIKRKAGLEQLNDSYTRMAAFPDMFGDKLRIVGDYSTDDFRVMAKYLQQLAKLSDDSLKDKQTKGFIKLSSINTSYFAWDLAQVKETKRRLQEDGGGTYEVTVDYYQPFLVVEYIQTQNNSDKKEVISLSKAFNKFKMKEAADYWAKIQSRYTKDREFIVKLTTSWMDVIGKSSEQDNVIVYSRAAIDVLRMSDHPDISSCHSQRGSYFECAIQEAIRGGAIAYSVKKADLQKIIDEDKLQDIEIFADPERNIEGIVPNGRVRIRRMFDTDTKTEYALPEIRTYGDDVPSSFRKTVLKWAAENQRKKFINPETNEFQLPSIVNAIKVGGSYNDNVPFHLYADLVREVATTFGEDKNTIDVPRFHIDNISVNEGQDLSTECERRAGELTRQANFTDVNSLVVITDYNVYCKKDGKVGVYGNKSNFVNNDGYNEEYNEDFDSIEVTYSFGIGMIYVKGKVKVDLTEENFKQLIEKTEEISPNGFIYRIYKEFGLKDKTFKIEQINEWGERNVQSRDRITKNNKYFSTEFSITYVDASEINLLNSKIVKLNSYADFNNSIYDVLEFAGNQLGLIDLQPFNSPYAKRLFRDINTTDYMYYSRGIYGGYVVLRSPTLAKRNIKLNSTAQTFLPGAQEASFANPRRQTPDHFYLYEIPKEALRASVTLATSKTHPGKGKFEIDQLNQQSFSKIYSLYRDIRNLATEVRNNMILLFPQAVRPYIEFSPTVTEPRFISDEDRFNDNINILFDFKLSISDSLSTNDQEEALKVIKYLYENFEQFKDSLDETLIDALRNTSNEGIKNLIQKYYVKGIEGSAPQAEPKLDLTKEGILQTLAEGVAALTMKNAKKYWISQNGNNENYRIPFFTVLLKDNLTIRTFYSRTFQHKKVIPWKEQVDYADFKIRTIPEQDRLNSLVFIYCVTGEEHNRKWPASRANVEVGNYGIIVEELSKFIYVRGYDMIPTKVEEQKDVLAGYEDEMEFDIDAETKADQEQLMNMYRNQSGPVSQRKPQQKEPEQLGLFERKQRNKLIKERLLNWYKRNK